MAPCRMTWEELSEDCPEETAAIKSLLDEYDIELNRFLRALIDDEDWHDVVDIRDLHLRIGEVEEARLEDSVIQQLEDAWRQLTTSFRNKTESEGLCYYISEIVFENEFDYNDQAFFEVELAPAHLTASQLLKRGETTRCEFKSTLRVNLHTGEMDKRMEHECLKTIAAFLNSDGGYLVIGVNDKAEVIGLDNDRFPSEDKMNLHLVNILKQRLGAEHLVHVEPRFESLSDKSVLVVRCRASKLPVYLKEGKTEQFYVRTGAATTELLPSQIQGYLKQRF